MKAGAQPKDTPMLRHLLQATVGATVLVAFLTLTAKLEPGQPMDFLAPYKRYIMAGGLAILGSVVIEQGTLFLRKLYERRISPDVGVLVRIVGRIAGYGVLAATLVSLFTANAAAVLTLGSFFGLVAGFASQTVMGNALAGVFLAITRPFRPGDRVTIGGNSGLVHDIGIMHTILDAGERYILIPSSTIVSSVVFRQKEAGTTPS